MVGNHHDGIGTNIDMLRAPIVIGVHDFERLRLTELFMPLIAPWAMLVLDHHEHEQTREGGIAMLTAIWRGFAEQRWTEPQLQRFWAQQQTEAHMERAIRLLRAGDREGFVAFSGEMMTRYPLPRFRVDTSIP